MRLLYSCSFLQATFFKRLVMGSLWHGQPVLHGYSSCSPGFLAILFQEGEEPRLHTGLGLDLSTSSYQLCEAVVVQSLSHVWLFATPWTAARQASLSITVSLSLLQFMPIKSVMPSSHLILCHPLLLPPSIFPSIRIFSNESVLRIRWPKYWSFSFSISPSDEYSGLISFRMDWFDLLTVQGTLKSFLRCVTLLLWT